MITKNKVTIIGQSKDLVKTFNYFFKGKTDENISFRRAWNNLKLVKKSHTIVISGFHHEICNFHPAKLLDYINKYHRFLLELKKKCSNLYIISTDLRFKYSLSRVLYFYYLLNHKIKIKDNFKIISFETLYGFEKGFFSKFKILIFKLMNIRIFHYKTISNKFKNSKTKITPDKIKFFFIQRPRSRKIDRIIRFFIDLIVINFILKIFKV